MLVLDANVLRPTKANFINIMCGNELEEFAENKKQTKDVQTFYYEKLVEFVSAFRHSCARKIEFRWIIFISARGVFSETIEQIVRDSKTPFKPEIVYGQSWLFSEIGIWADRNPWIIRVYSKEKLIVSKDFGEYFNKKFGRSSISWWTWNEFWMDELEENVKLAEKLKPKYLINFNLYYLLNSHFKIWIISNFFNRNLNIFLL